LAATRLPGWSHSTTTARHFTNCASPTRCYPECMLERQDSDRPCSTPRTRRLSGRSSARAGRSQAITLRIRMSEQYGACFELSGSSTTCVPTPSSVLQIESLPGLPADRIPRLHAVAEAAQRGQLDAQHLRAMPPEDARAELQQLPG